MRILKWIGILVVLLIAAGAVVIYTAGDTATLPQEAGYGANPTLPAPHPTFIPTINFAGTAPWTSGAMPKPAEGLKVEAFATQLDHPRWLYVLPNGDVLVAETNSPPHPDDEKGFRGFVAGVIMGSAGAKSTSPNKIVLLRDSDNDGVADKAFDFLTGLNSPFGMALIGDTLYVANTDGIVKVPYHAGDTHITAMPVKVVDLPGGTLNHHWTKNIVASPDGTKLYASVGSNSNAGENGIDKEEGRAAIWEIDLATGKHRIFASGIRNPVGMDFVPGTNTLWTAVNERDEIGSDLVPDYMTSVRDGGFYGWPYSYFGQHVDVRAQPQRPDLVAKALVPDYALGAHTASLGLTFSDKAQLGPAYAHGVFVGQHGSWNRNPRAGYRVIFVPFTGDKPSGPPREVLTGFLNADGKAQGRPVGVVIAKDGALLVADDVGNTVWRVSAK
ncbi:MAG: sorbosone dehydrogenase family protein [Alphaproteobacteria bacterium]|nr:sorbosone dehydrogenase family protein [Alphaproteobacteria bacterium]MBL6938345.1 sorbosone dehydrogenase family protein [Alphaproteobacteria bacterium]MBL7096404.1 sorbosone dehydrogenase family protein [Alphaproteobacteria bacterium]